MTTETIEVLIENRREDAEGIVVLDLVAPDGRELPEFDAGAHVDVHIGPDLVRQYSLCGSSADRSRYRLGILNDPTSRGGSRAVHASFRQGNRIRIGAPRNQFPLEAGATRTILIGGGIGITPLLAMAYHLDRTGGAFELHYCARERSRAAFLGELEGAVFRGHTQLHFDDGPAAQRLDFTRDLPAPEPGTHIYVCGPTGFMDWVIEGARDRGHPEARIHREYFAAEVDATGDSFEVVIAGSGRSVQVPANTSIVKALGAAGIRVTVSCEQGICGTCLCNVVEGVPDHRDNYLTDDEKAAGDQMLLCCSRSKTPKLVIEL